jgi:hypothetical protein
MPARSVIQPLVVDRAEKKHYCRYNKKHVINKGDKRLKIKVDMSYQTYCSSCAVQFISTGITNLSLTLSELDVEQVS